MKKRTRRIVIAVLSAIIILLVPVTLVEISARRWVWTGLLNMNPAALDIDYTPELHRERNDPAKSSTWHDGDYYTLDDYTGTYMNHRNGVRVTTDQPAHAPHTLYIFGNSVVYGVTNADRNTLPSSVQRLTQDYMVINEGGSGSTFSFDNKIKTLHLKPGDVVIYFNGIDEMLGISKNAHNQDMDLVARACQSLTLIACTRYNLQSVPSPLLDPAWLGGQLVRVRNEMLTTLRSSANYTRSQGARFIWILQGDMWSLPLTASVNLVGPI